jgi:heptaprenylglyceryl phosphate synthase
MSTNSQIAFSPLGETIVVAAAAVAPAGTQAPVYQKFDPQNAGQFRFVNAGTNTVFIGTGASAAEATANAVAPVAGNPSPAVVLLPGSIEILRFNKDTYFSGLAAAANTVYITPGQGL